MLKVVGEAIEDKIVIVDQTGMTVAIMKVDADIDADMVIQIVIVGVIPITGIIRKLMRIIILTYQVIQ